MNSALKSFLVCTYEWCCAIVFSLPRYVFFNQLKASYIRLMGGRVGKRVTFYPGVKINPLYGIELGDDVDLAWGVIITTGGKVKIGDRVLVGYRTIIVSANHVIPSRNELIFNSGHTCKEVIIENDAWIGGNVVILPGIRIGEGAVVAAGSVVTKFVEPFTIVAGNPARKIKDRM